MRNIISKTIKIINNSIPSAYSFALLLTILTFMLVISFTSMPLTSAIESWGGGLWKFNGFAMQMLLVLLFGASIANSKFMSPFIISVAKKPKTNTQAVMLVTIISLASCYINWGFGLVISALLAVEVIRCRSDLNKGLIVSSAYSGFLIWHGGLSASISLKLTNPSQLIQPLLSKTNFSLSETIFSNFNLLILTVTIICILATNYFLSKLNYLTSKHKKFNSDINCSLKDTGSAHAIDSSKVPVLIISILLAGYLFISIYHAAQFTLDLMITVFMFFSILLNSTVDGFVKSITKSITSCSAIIIQFPLYAGIMTLLTLSGLGQAFSDYLIGVANKDTFLLFTYLSSGVLNFLVPSGGGQWLIQGPVILKAASALDISQAQAALAISWGDAWTNMIQPFWALPIMSIVGIKLREFSIYSIVVFIVIGLVQACLFLLI